MFRFMAISFAKALFGLPVGVCGRDGILMTCFGIQYFATGMWAGIWLRRKSVLMSEVLRYTRACPKAVSSLYVTITSS